MYDVPAEFFQRPSVSNVPCPIGFYFVFPKSNPRLGQTKNLATRVAMPKTTVYNYNGVVFWKHDVGLARQILYMKSVTISFSKQSPSDYPFRSGVLAPDSAHDFTPLPL
jgi:hypothetical protein